MSSLDDDPLSPASRAHVDHMYMEALAAEDGAVPRISLSEWDLLAAGLCYNACLESPNVK